MPGVVYVIGVAGSPVVKIGRSAKPAGRLGDIQRMSPVRLEIRWQVEGGAELEGALHRRFKELRTHGEWFDFGDLDPVAAVEAAVDAIRAEADAADAASRGYGALVQDGGVTTSPMQEVRTHFRDYVDSAWQHGRHTVIERHSRPVAVLVPISWYISKGGDPREPLPDIAPEVQ